MSQAKKSKNKHPNTGILYVKNSSSKSNKHVKRGRKGRDCVFFDTEMLTCTHSSRNHEFCNSDSCDYFRDKTPHKTSSYDEDYISIPVQAGIHERTNEYIGISKNIGTPCHVGYLKGDGERRHKARCIYYEKNQKLCSHYGYRCPGSSNCERYEENTSTY